MRADRIIKNTLRPGVIVVSLVLATGCYEDRNPDSPQAQSPQPAAGQNPGPITSMGNQGNSALGGAKRAAENTIDRAQQKSKEIADQADGLNKDG